jgi:hypothetical protein
MDMDAKEMVAELEKAKGLTDWEGDFLVSIQGQIAKGYNLSEKQSAIIERIYKERVLNEVVERTPAAKTSPPPAKEWDDGEIPF